MLGSALLATTGQAQILTAQLTAPLPVETPSAPNVSTPSLPPIQSPLPTVPLPAPAAKITPSQPLPLPDPSLPGTDVLTTPTAPVLGPGPTPILPGGSLGELADGVTSAPLPGAGGSPTTEIANAVAGIQAAITGSPAAVAATPVDDILEQLARATPRDRARLSRQIWDRPLRGKPLERLRDLIAGSGSCFATLSPRGQRALSMRAGLGRGGPASRRAVARRLGIPLHRALRLERSAVNRLRGAHGCGGGGPAGTSAAHIGAFMLGLTDAPEAVTPRGAPAHTIAVRGVQAFGGADMPRARALEEAADGGTQFTLLAFLAILLALVIAAAIATRRTFIPYVVAAATPIRGNGRPLLFLDVDGVVALDPFSRHLPPGRWHHLVIGDVYVSDRSGELIRELASRFDLVWATGWEHRANANLPRLLGLDGELPVLTFGKSTSRQTSEWKIKKVNRYARHRPAAWIDDTLDERHDAWAARRDMPTALVKPDPHEGITPAQVKYLVSWADSLEPPAARAPEARAHH